MAPRVLGLPATAADELGCDVAEVPPVLSGYYYYH